MKQLRLLLIEPDTSGHRMVLHVRLIAQEAVARGWQVDLLTSESARGHPALAAVEHALPDDHVVHFVPSIPRAAGSTRFWRVLQQWRHYRAVSEGIRRVVRGARVPDVAYVVNLDNLYQPLAIARRPFAGLPFAGMMMGLAYHRAPMGLGRSSAGDRLAAWLFRRVLAIPNLRAVTVIDEALHAYAMSAGDPIYERVAYVPDVGLLEPGISREAARRLFEIADDCFVVLVYGSLTARKGVRELLAALAAFRDDSIVLLLAGAADAEVDRMVLAYEQELPPRGRIVRSPGFHDPAAESTVFAAADAVWIGYVDFYGSSGVLYQAGSAGLPVIAAADGLIGWLAATHRLGVICDPRDAQAVASALCDLRARPDLRAEWGANGRALALQHTPRAFASAICDALERA